MRPLYSFLCGVRAGFNCSRRIECSSLCYTALSQLTRFYVCLKCRPIKVHIFTHRICVCICMYVFMYVCMYVSLYVCMYMCINVQSCRMDYIFTKVGVV